MNIVFVHANGVPGPVYAPLLKRVQSPVSVLPLLGHSADYPVDDEWVSLTREVEAHVQALGGGKCILVGHSLGALLSFRLALKKPDLVAGLVMLDPPLFYGPMAWVMRSAKWLGQIDLVTPAHLSKRRKRLWPDMDAAESYFRSKRFYASFHEECFHAWMQNALIQGSEGVGLAFSVDTEVEIFRTTPLWLDRLPKKLSVPSLLVVGRQSEACWKVCFDPFVQDFNLNLHTVDGDHMFPLKHLASTADLINRFVDSLERPR